MHPWTTRTLQAAVMAAGFAAAGTATASAEEAPRPAPDLSPMSDEVGFSVPVDTCGMQEGTALQEVQAPCADAQFEVRSPNLLKQVGADVTTTADGLAGELRNGQPVLAPGKPQRLLGHLTAEASRVEQLTKARPTISAEVQPENTGALDQHAAGGDFLDAEIGPRQPDHEGVSAADTAVDLTAVQGYDLQPVASPGAALDNAPAEEPTASPSPSKLGNVLPAANDMPALAMLDNGISKAAQQLAQDAATGLPKLPLGESPQSQPANGPLGLV